MASTRLSDARIISGTAEKTATPAASKNGAVSATPSTNRPQTDREVARAGEKRCPTCLGLCARSGRCYTCKPQVMPATVTAGVKRCETCGKRTAGNGRCYTCKPFGKVGRSAGSLDAIAAKAAPTPSSDDRVRLVDDAGRSVAASPVPLPAAPSALQSSLGDPELGAMASIVATLRSLEEPARRRVLAYVTDRFWDDMPWEDVTDETKS